MRRVWERMGSVLPSQLVPAAANAAKLAEAEQAVRDNENRRESVKKLFSLSLLAGQLDRARDVADRWSTRDALDADALMARADVAASSGNRDDAIRILGSVVDVLLRVEVPGADEATAQLPVRRAEELPRGLPHRGR